MDVVSTSHLFHYAVAGDSDFDAILREGLRPLSDFPDSDRWRQIEQHAPGFFERLYSLVAEPVLGVSYERSGIFLTPMTSVPCLDRCSTTARGFASRSSGGSDETALGSSSTCLRSPPISRGSRSRPATSSGRPRFERQ